MTTLRDAQELVEKNLADEGFNIANKHLLENVDDQAALAIAVAATYKTHDKIAIGYYMCKHLITLMPTSTAAWFNLGRAASILQLFPESIRAYKKALQYAGGESAKVHPIYINMSAALVDAGDFDQAEHYIKKALEITPDSKKALGNLGFCQLAKRQWVPGWENYHQVMGYPSRMVNQYGDEPEWDGAPGKKVALYAEQGIGDVILFASMIEDAVRDCEKVILDVDAKLKNLFRRSFPDCKVYGTRYKDVFKWDAEDADIDASLAMGQIGEFYRLKDEDFPGKPYLKPCPDRTAMWDHLFSLKKKPVIGVAWSGGLPKTGSRYRWVGLEDMMPIFESVDAHFVSLQYHPAREQIEEFRFDHPEIDLVEYPYATLTSDYDDTAALVAALDMVVSVPTAVVHLALGLGTNTIAMKSPHSCWKFHGGLAFTPNLILVEYQDSWQKTVQETAKHVKTFFESSSVTMKEHLLQLTSSSTPSSQKLNGESQLSV